MNSKEVNFRARIINNRYNSDTYKIYVVDIDTKIYPKVKSNKQNEFVLVGNMPSLVPNVDYEVKASIEVNKKFGIQYKVKNIRRDKPTDFNSSKSFLEEILTENQAKVLLNEYPDIVDRVIKNNLNDIDLNKLHGIGEKTFRDIKSKIIENFCLIDLVDKFGGLIDMSTIKKLYDKYSNVKIIEKHLKQDPYRCLCDLSRIAFKTADSILLNIERLNKENPNKYKFGFDFELKHSEQRMISCLNYILEDNESKGNTKMTLKEARENCGKLVPECIDLFVKAIKENNNYFYVDMENKVISKMYTYNIEQYIADFIKEIIKVKIPWNINCDVYRNVEDMEMTDEQINTLYMMCENNIGILTACGGSGKSSSVKALINMLDDNNKTYKLMTPTGASSKVLESYTNRPCGTIHRQLEYKPTPEKDNPWGFNENNKLTEDIIIVDEFSMVDIFLFKHLIDAIDINKTKLLLVFDPYQLPSVACGNIAQDLLSSKVVPTTILTKIFRYGEGGLMNVATKTRNSEKFLPSDFNGNKIFGTKKDFIYMEMEQSIIPKQILKIYSKLINDGYSLQDIMVLSCQNKGDYGTKAINKYIQTLIQKGNNNKFVMRGETKFYKGDKVIQIINNYKAETPLGGETEIFNGNTGIIVDVGYNELTVEYDKNLMIKYNKEDLNQLELGYCISIHKSQGSSAKQVIIIAPKSHTFMMNSNLLYVAETRAKERVYMLGNIKTINSAIKKKENLSRNTWLQIKLS